MKTVTRYEVRYVDTENRAPRWGQSEDIDYTLRIYRTLVKLGYDKSRLSIHEITTTERDITKNARPNNETKAN